MNAKHPSIQRLAIASIAMLPLALLGSTAEASMIVSYAAPHGFGPHEFGPQGPQGLTQTNDPPPPGEFTASATRDAVVEDENGDHQFTNLLEPARPDRLRIAKGKWSPGESRVLLEFDLSGRTPANVGAASLEFFIDLVADSSAPVEIYGFAGDGSLDLDDANRQGELLGAYDAGQLGIGAQSVVLNALAMSRLLTPGVTTIEIRLEASRALVDTAIDKVDPLFASSAPLLRLTSVPEPTTLGLSAVALLAAACLGRGPYPTAG